MSLTARALSLALLFATGHVLADEANSDSLRAQAKTIRDVAERDYTLTTYHCYDKFLVNACLDDAKLARLEQVKEARALEAQANRMDRSKRVKAMEARLRKVEGEAQPAPSK